MKLHDNQALQKELNQYSKTLIAQKKIYSQVLVETMTGDVQNLEEIRKMLIETASLEAKNNRLNEEIMHMVTKSNMRKLKEYYFRVLHMDDNDQASSSSKTKDFVTLTDLQSAGTSASDYMTDKLLDSEDGSELKFKECFEFSFAESESDAYSHFSLNPVMKKKF